MQGRLIPITDAYTMIGYRKSTIYNMIRDGKISAVKIGSRAFLTESEIERFRNENMRPLEVTPTKARQSAIA